MWHRMDHWRVANPVENEVIETFERPNGKTQGVIYTEWAFQCSYLRCQSYEGLRETRSGIWCRKHYLSLPGCPICGEPIVMDKVWFPGNGFCRDHMTFVDEEG